MIYHLLTVALGTPRAPKARCARPPIMMGATGRTASENPRGTPQEAGRDIEKVARGATRWSSARERRLQQRAA